MSAVLPSNPEGRYKAGDVERVPIFLGLSFLTCKMHTSYGVTSEIPSRPPFVDLNRGHQCASLWESSVDLRKEREEKNPKRKGRYGDKEEKNKESKGKSRLTQEKRKYEGE